jgi:hypothetical protein
MGPALAPFHIPLMTTIGGFRLVSAMAVTCCCFAETMMLFIPLRRSGFRAGPARSFGRSPTGWRRGEVVPFRKKPSYRSANAG